MEKKLKKLLPNGGFVGVTAKRSKTMSAIRGKNNHSTELKLRMAFVRKSIKGWTSNAKLILGNPDFFFTKKRLAVFVDGCFWHGCPKCGHFPKSNRAFWKAKILRNRQRDQLVNRKLKRKGIKVIRIWEHSLQRQEELSHTINKILGLLSFVWVNFHNSCFSIA